jgi:spore coat protein CotH
MGINNDLENCKTADDFWGLYDLYDAEVIEKAVWSVTLNDNLLDDEDVMHQICCVYHPRNLQYASDRLKNDRSFVAQVLSVDGIQLKHVGYNLKSDKSIVFLAVFNNSFSLEYVCDELKFDRDVLICACRHSLFTRDQNNRTAFDFVKNCFPTDFELAV